MHMDFRSRPLAIMSLAVAITFTATPDARTRIWNINASGTGDAPTIQAAIDLAVPGDEIVVSPGTYDWVNQGHTGDYGMVYFKTYKTGLILRSSGGPEVTILDARFSGRVMFIQGHNDIVIDGFTLTNGVAPLSYDGGGGLIGHLADPVIRNCIFVNNSAQQGGGLWFGGVSAPVIEDCLFYGNSAYYGGGICLVNSSDRGIIRRCIIRDNYAEARGGGLIAHN